MSSFLQCSTAVIAGFLQRVLYVELSVNPSPKFRGQVTPENNYRSLVLVWIDAECVCSWLRNSDCHALHALLQVYDEIALLHYANIESMTQQFLSHTFVHGSP